MPRFAVLLHDWPIPHRDLMLERDGVLLTWRLAVDDDTVAERFPDHQVQYLDYEGPVSGDRGSVTRLDGGEMAWLTIAAKRFEFELNGSTWQGRFELTLLEDPIWRLRSTV